MPDRKARVEVANRFIEAIARYGRHFFRHGNEVSRFSLGFRGTVWFIDKYSKRAIYTHYSGRWRGFTEGGTLKRLVEDLREYIMGRAPLPLHHLGPWPKNFCDGDPWGYGDEAMGFVRREARALAKDAGT